MCPCTHVSVGWGFSAQGRCLPLPGATSCFPVGCWLPACWRACGHLALGEWWYPACNLRVGGLPPLVIAAAFSGRTGILRLRPADQVSPSPLLTSGPGHSLWGCPGSRGGLSSVPRPTRSMPGAPSAPQILATTAVPRPPPPPAPGPPGVRAPEWPWSGPLLPCFQRPTFRGLSCLCWQRGSFLATVNEVC